MKVLFFLFCLHLSLIRPIDSCITQNFYELSGNITVTSEYISSCLYYRIQPNVGPSKEAGLTKLTIGPLPIDLGQSVLQVWDYYIPSDNHIIASYYNIVNSENVTSISIISPIFLVGLTQLNYPHHLIQFNWTANTACMFKKH